MQRLHTAAAVALALAIATPAAAQQQDPAVRRARERAGAAVKSIRTDPAQVQIEVGDTAEVSFYFLDEAGNTVLVELPDGRTELPALMPLTRAVRPVRIEGNKVWLIGIEVTPEPIRVGIIRPPFPINPTQRPTFDPFTLPITVVEAPVVKLEIEAPTLGAYAGSSLQLAARVWRRGQDRPAATPWVRWSSSNRAVATVDEHGLVSFVAPGSVTITAESEGVRAMRALTVARNPVASIALAPRETNVRTGDVVRLNPTVLDAAGRPVRDVPVTYGVSSGGSSNVRANAAVYEDGTFVAEQPGAYTVFAQAGGRTTSAKLTARARDVVLETRLVSHKPLVSFGTSEVMVFEGKNSRDYAYLGTWGNGDRVYVFDVTDPANPAITDSVLVDARVINDIRVDTVKGANIAVFTREGASDRRNGIVILDVGTDPAHPKKLAEFTETTTAGVHDVWLYQNRIYLTNDGTGDMHIIDITDPRNPKETGRWSVGTPGRYLHDLIFMDGIGYLSYWDDGMIILDVGGGGKGGTLDQPVFVSQYKYGPYGNTHHVYRYKNLVFISDELLSPNEGAHASGPGGYVHIVDVSDLEQPREIARYEVPEAGAHNTWVEDDKLYVAHYQGGLRVVDVSGELRGDLYQQGREIAWYHTAGEVGEAHTPGQAMAWSPQLYKGNIFVSDLNSGLWVIKLVPRTPVLP